MKQTQIRFLRFAVRAVVPVLAVSAVMMAQDQAPGGWRRVGDPAPDAPAATAPPPAPAPGADMQDPAEPVDRSDQYGQPGPSSPQPSQANPPAAAPRYEPAPNRPMNRPAYGLPARLTLQPGTFISVRMNQPLSSDRNQPGDAFTAALEQPVVVDGVVVANRGQNVYGRVAEVQKHHGDKPSRLGVELTSLTLADGNQAPLHSQLVARQGPTTPGGAQAGTVVGTTAVGAAVGAAADWGRGAAIGAGAGAAAGIVGVILTRHHPSVIYPEAALTFRVESPVTIATDRAPQAFRYVGPDDYNRPVQRQMVQARPAVPYGYRYGSPYYGYGYGYGPYYPYPYWGGGMGMYWGSGYYRGRRW
jgi:hypothetical protein